MFILNNPYVSDYLVETIKKNNFPVLDFALAREYFSVDKLIKTEFAKNEKKYYLNSENSIDWIFENLPNSDLSRMIRICKDKIEFRKILSEIYPNYYFREVELSELKNLDVQELKFPFVLKPSVGFLSFGVYPIKNAEDFEKVLVKIADDLEKIKNVFPSCVVDCSKFIIEEMIEGEEYALDAYFDEDGKATILNIFHHPFFDENDVSDRVYYTSKEIVKKYLKVFEELLNKIGKVGKFKNFPFHLELRANENAIIPIEINPMRFCGWCITDIAQNAWGINVYEYYFNNLKPNWSDILDKSDDSLYYFTIGDIPSEIKKDEIKKINFEKYLSNISNPLVVRKIDHKTKPVFAIVFAKCKDESEIKNLLKLNMKDFIELEKQ